jgi:cystathionine gamma-synthase
VHRVAVTDTAGWVAMCGVADLIWLESPSNPLLIVGDLDVICAAPRKRGGILAVDSTFATPLNQRPLVLGADAAVHSVTKLIGGHSDLLGGVVTVRDASCGSAAAGQELAGAPPAPSRPFSRSAGPGRWHCGWSGRSATR